MFTDVDLSFQHCPCYSLQEMEFSSFLLRLQIGNDNTQNKTNNSTGPNLPTTTLKPRPSTNSTQPTYIWNLAPGQRGQYSNNKNASAPALLPTVEYFAGTRIPRRTRLNPTLPQLGEGAVIVSERRKGVITVLRQPVPPPTHPDEDTTDEE